KAARLALRPLTSLELRRALLESQAATAGNGRSVSSALAGLKGFALGITKGVGGALLFDVITSNETAAYISNMLENSNGGSTNAGTTQEVCFASRSVDGD
ncbi:CG13438, partial [Drosophila busckii]